MTTATLRAPAPQPATPAAPDFAAIKQRQQATWASGDFAVIGVTLQIVGESLAEAADIRAGESVLDVAAGNGNATLAAARRFADVTSTDYVPELLNKGYARAMAEGAYRIIDEPAPSALSRLAVNPFWIVLVGMLLSRWQALALLWFVFNGFALNSPTKLREIGWAAGALVIAIGFVVDELNRLTGIKAERGDATVDCYVVLNDVLGDRVPEEPVEPTLLGIAGGVVRSLSTAATVTQLVRLYRAARGVGFGFHFACIPADYPMRLPAIRFEPERMRDLFDYSRARAVAGYPWAEYPPHLDSREVVVNLTAAVAKPPARPGVMARLRAWLNGRRA